MSTAAESMATGRYFNDTSHLMGSVVFAVSNVIVNEYPELQIPATEVCATEEATRLETVLCVFGRVAREHVEASTIAEIFCPINETTAVGCSEVAKTSLFFKLVV